MPCTVHAPCRLPVLMAHRRRLAGAYDVLGTEGFGRHRVWSRASILNGTSEHLFGEKTHAIALIVVGVLALSMSAAAEKRASGPTPGKYLPSEYAPYDSAGRATIIGAGSASPMPGVRATVAMRSVQLTPLTSWSDRWWERWVLRGVALETADPRGFKSVREVTADSLGQFRFEHLAAGENYLRSSVLWWKGLSGREGAEMALVVMGKKVVLGPGQHVEITLDSLRTERDSYDRFWDGCQYLQDYWPAWCTLQSPQP